MLRDFMVFCTRMKSKNPKHLQTPLFLTLPSNKWSGPLVDDCGFPIILLISEQNEYGCCLYQAVFPYFLIRSMPRLTLNKTFNQK